jgi:hypothetical protein
MTRKLVSHSRLAQEDVWDGGSLLSFLIHCLESANIQFKAWGGWNSALSLPNCTGRMI